MQDNVSLSFLEIPGYVLGNRREPKVAVKHATERVKITLASRN